MNPMTFPFGRRLAALAIALTSAYAVPSLAAGGCTRNNLATYQIGQTTYVDVSNDVPVDTVVRTGSATGEGKLLLTCRAGDAQFRGRWESGVPSNGVIALTVGGGRPSGFGVRLTLEEEGSGQPLTFPHDFSRNFAEGQPVRSDADRVTYEIVRMTGPVAFGVVDRGRIAQSSVSTPTGALEVFRAMEIYDLIFRRPSCSISTETLNQTVQLDPATLVDFSNAERATKWQAFNLTVSECKEPVGLVARFTFGTATDADVNRPELFAIPMGPKNVGLEIADGGKRTIEPGKPYDANALATGKDFEFNVRLRESRYAVSGGRFSRPVKVMVEFL